MKIWEAHRDLSLNLGDSVGLEEFTSSNPPVFIPDGVRYKKALRSSYLYRAMVTVLNNSLRQLVGIDKQKSNDILFRLFPNMISRASVNTIIKKNTYVDIHKDALGGFKVLYLLSCNIRDGLGKEYPLPIKSPLAANKLRNSRNVQRSDAFCTYYTQVAGDIPEIYMRLFIYDQTLIADDFTQVKLIFLPLPKNPEDQGIEEELTFEESYYNTIINMASIFGYTDSQETQSPERFAPNTMDTTIITGGNNVGFPNQ